ncbi:MAG: enoyl-CoA hydratase [Usitatibacteraceae bacterium]
MSSRLQLKHTDHPMDTNTMTAEVPIVQSQSEGVVILTLNRPKQYNALSLATLELLHTALDGVAADESVRVVVIAANGGAFCAGHDLKEMRAAKSQAFVTKLFQLCSDAMLKIARLPVPVIAEVNGMATAAGCQLVAQCDLAIAADTAKFAVSGVNLGLFCSTPAVPLSRAISRKRAAEMLMTGEFIDAATAQDWGLLNRVVPSADLRAETQKMANALMSKPRSTLATGKALFYRQLEAGLEDAYGDASATIACNFMDADAQEGVAAFLEKRKPDWDQSGAL